MTLHQLGKTLHDMYFNSKKGESVVMIHFFGVKYAHEIKSSDASKREIVEAAGISKSYATELSKAVKLAEFVRPK
ncbi:hypothetical protein Q5L94_02215 [Idiomarina sp. Sol25]|uniref:HTH-like domain-containing protein n=1 Tax=Idiomarina sp. Sol25 TaxID=3064000 RepID=UPI00294B0159|nr:hypothetical protein [Idiomarina sp. Sol25]MDV6326854.1 hypothetical protein [Idiomarina sp. Sol25]